MFVYQPASHLRSSSAAVTRTNPPTLASAPTIHSHRRPIVNIHIHALAAPAHPTLTPGHPLTQLTHIRYTRPQEQIVRLDSELPARNIQYAMVAGEAQETRTGRRRAGGGGVEDDGRAGR